MRVEIEGQTTTTTTRAAETRATLQQLIHLIEEAEAEAAATSWQDEKDEALKRALAKVHLAVGALEYALRWRR
jgi:ribosomal protein L17